MSGSAIGKIANVRIADPRAATQTRRRMGIGSALDQAVMTQTPVLHIS